MRSAGSRSHVPLDLAVIPALAGVALVLTQYFQVGRIVAHAAPLFIWPLAQAFRTMGAAPRYFVTAISGLITPGRARSPGTARASSANGRCATSSSNEPDSMMRPDRTPGCGSRCARSQGGARSRRWCAPLHHLVERGLHLAPVVAWKARWSPRRGSGSADPSAARARSRRCRSPPESERRARRPSLRAPRWRSIIGRLRCSAASRSSSVASGLPTRRLSRSSG